jgi:hypothetical protein
MILLVKIINWITLVLSTIATIELIGQSDQGVTGNGIGILIGFIWLAQSLTILVFLHQWEQE